MPRSASSAAQARRAHPLERSPEPYSSAEVLPLSQRWRRQWRALNRWPLTMMLSSLLLGLGIVQLSFHLVHSLYRSTVWSRETQESQVRIVQLQQAIQVLEQAKQQASTDAYLEELARCEGFVRRSEVVVISRDAPSVTGEPCGPKRLP